MGWPPKLFGEQSTAERIFALFIGPVALGAICGWLLGVTEIGYTVLTVLAVLGGLGAGYEHVRIRDGALRGLWGGTLFGLAICEVHRLIGNNSTASTPKPIEIIVIVFAAISVVLGVIGSALRRRREGQTVPS
jgi:uncharacterized membrane protein YoaK (UPF0700 family)